MFARPVQKNPGLIDTGFDPRDYHETELIAGGFLSGEEVEVPKEYYIDGLVYENQGPFPTCTAHSTTTVIEKKYDTFRGLALSQMHLFLHSGGTERGNSFTAPLNLAKKLGAIKYERMPMPTEKPANWLEHYRNQAEMTPFTDAFKIGAYLRIDPDVDSMKQALLKYGPLLVGVAANNGIGNKYGSTGHTRAASKDNHEVVLDGFNEENWRIHDSLAFAELSKGKWYPSLDYEFKNVFAITEIDVTHEQIEENKEKTLAEEFSIALAHYNKRRDLWGPKGEQAVALKLREAFDTSHNYEIQKVANKFWTVYSNATTYAGYSIQDMLNDAHHFVRTQGREHAFNLNRPRK
uniref:Peptidase n=1 Tax=viral metagenome TaxID=1070528 RepID=A0A6M3Y637_9ZZZZ